MVANDTDVKSPLTRDVLVPQRDVVALGALNVDLIATASKMRLLDPDLIGEIAILFEKNQERIASLDEIDELIEQVGDDQDVLTPSLGGSSFLTLVGLAHMGLGLRLGFVGVAGRTTRFALASFEGSFETLHIDSRFVFPSDESSGICVSVIDEGERSLFTYPGANVEFARQVQSDIDNVVDYLAHSRIVHVSSLLDPDTLDPESPAALADLVERAVSVNPLLKVSFDPGSAWCRNQPDGFDRLLKAADFLFVNEGEFKALSRKDVAVTGKDKADPILDRCKPSGAVVLVKAYDRICIYSRVRRRTVETCFSHKPLTVPEIEDATGAGDVFAGGFLAARASERLQVELGSLLGMTLARKKLGFAGTSGHNVFAPITDSFMRELETRLLEENRSRTVFLSHGHAPLWQDVRTYIESACATHVECFETEMRVGRVVASEVISMIHRCGAAIILLTAEDLRIEEGGTTQTPTARQNVVHELGMVQMWLHPEKIALLVERGVALPSNVAGILNLPFERDNVQKVLPEIRRFLAQNKILGP